MTPADLAAHLMAQDDTYRAAANRVSALNDDEGAAVTGWDQQVERGKRLVGEIGDRKWELGDLANEVCEAGPSGAHDGRLADFAEAIGVTASTLNDYRLVAKAWVPSARALGQTWTTHKALASHEDRKAIIAEQIWTYNSLSQRLGRLPNPSRQKPDAESVEQSARPDANPVREAALGISAALASSDTAKSLIDSPETKRLINEAITNSPEMAGAATQALEDRRAAAAASRPPVAEPHGETTRDQYGELLDLVANVRKAHQSLTAVVAAAQNLRGPAADKMAQALREEIEWIRGACDVIETGLNDGPLDEQIRELLEAEAGK